MFMSASPHKLWRGSAFGGERTPPASQSRPAYITLITSGALLAALNHRPHASYKNTSLTNHPCPGRRHNLLYLVQQGMTGRRGFHVHRAGSYEGVPVCLSAGLCGSLSSAYKCVNVNGGRRPRLGGLETEDRRSTGVAQTLSCTCPRIIWRQVGRRLGAYGVGWRDRLLPIRSSPLQYANVVRN